MFCSFQQTNLVPPWLNLLISILLFFKNFYFIDVVLISGVQQSDSIIHTGVCVLFQILFH